MDLELELEIDVKFDLKCESETGNKDDGVLEVEDGGESEEGNSSKLQVFEQHAIKVEPCYDENMDYKEEEEEEEEGEDEEVEDYGDDGSEELEDFEEPEIPIENVPRDLDPTEGPPQDPLELTEDFIIKVEPVSPVDVKKEPADTVKILKKEAKSGKKRKDIIIGDFDYPSGEEGEAEEEEGYDDTGEGSNQSEGGDVKSTDGIVVRKVVAGHHQIRHIVKRMQVADRLAKSSGSAPQFHQCCICGKVFRLRLTLYKHMNKHTNKYRCQQCGNSHQCISDLRRHELSHRGSADYRCEICKKMFLSEYTRDQHMDLHKPEGEFKCLLCDKNFYRYEYLKNHVDRYHTKFSQYKCYVCGEMFRLKGSLRKHIIKHTDKYKCHLCGKPCSGNWELQQHVDSHSTKPSYKCDVCAEMFLSEEIRKEHTKLHETVDGFKCTLCEAVFLNPDYLKSHVDVAHSDVSKHQCPVCSKSFKQKKSLKIHMQKHSDKFKCKVCGKKYESKRRFEDHVNTHSAAKCYECKRCHEKFISSYMIKKHKKLCIADMYHFLDGHIGIVKDTGVANDGTLHPVDSQLSEPRSTD